MACPAWCARGGPVKTRALSALPTLPQCHGTLPSATQHVCDGQGDNALWHCQRWNLCPGCSAGLPGDPDWSPTPQSTGD